MSEPDEVAAALLRHARRLDGLADELRSTFEATRGISLPPDACGLGGRRFVAAVEQVAQVGEGAVLAGAEALESAVARLREAAAARDRREVGAARSGGGAR